MPERASFTLKEGHVFNTVDKKLHSEEDAPAVVYADGTEWWYHEGRVHREGGPAVRFANGVEEYWQHNQRHRDQGPAVIYPSTAAIAPEMRGVKQYWTRGKLVREEVPPAVMAYRKLVQQAHAACFGKKP
jgi:hypothetical protein